jgi:hypothetical protein
MLNGGFGYRLGQEPEAEAGRNCWEGYPQTWANVTWAENEIESGFLDEYQDHNVL